MGYYDDIRKNLDLKKDLYRGIQTPQPVASKTPIPTKPVVKSVQPVKQQVQPIAKVPTKQFVPQYKPETYMKGNTIEKIFDTLLTPSYAIAGFQKGSGEERLKMQSEGKKYSIRDIPRIFQAGVSNIIPGVKQRVGWSNAPGDVNPLKLASEYSTSSMAKKVFSNPASQTTTNLLNTFGAPTIPIAKVAKVPGVTKAGSFVTNTTRNLAKNIPAVGEAIETVNPYFRNPQAGKILEGAISRGRARTTELFNTLKTLTKNLSPEDQRQIGLALEGKVRVVAPNLQNVVNTVRPIIQRVGKEAQEQKLLSGETLDKFKSGYLPHEYLEFLTDKNKTSGFMNLFKKTAPKVTAESFKQRKSQREDYIKEFATPVFRRIGEEIRAIEASKGYKDIAKTFGQKLMTGQTPGDISKIKDEKIRRIFKGVSLPQEVIDYINRVEQINKPGLGTKVLHTWKAIKTIYNPAYHIRNLISNQILTGFQTNENILKTVGKYGQAVFNYAGRGNQKFANAAQKIGLIKNPNVYDTTQEFLQKAELTKKSPVKNLVNLPRNLQTVTEETSKLNVFKTIIQKEANKAKISVEQALSDPQILKIAKDKAEEAIFSPYRISAAERSKIANIIPFYSFTRQMLPFFAKTVLKNPKAVAEYPRARSQIEALSGGDQRNAPKDLKGLVKLPIKNKEGKNIYYDPTYTLPYGNFDTEGGFPFGLSLNPFITEPIQQKANYDLYFGSPITRSTVPEIQREDKLKHSRRTFAPQIYNIIKDKLLPAFKGELDYKGAERSKLQAIFDALGIRTQSYSDREVSSLKRRELLEEQRKRKSERRYLEKTPKYNRAELERKRRLELLKNK